MQEFVQIRVRAVFYNCFFPAVARALGVRSEEPERLLLGNRTGPADAD